MASSLVTSEVATPNGSANAPAVEPPQFRKIRGQVEYYFSDENLRTDLHLLQCCNGRENVPVSISRICGWRMMRQYNKRDVVAALRNSKKLEVTEDGKKVYRKVALTGPCLLDPDFKSNKPSKQPGGPTNAKKEGKENDAADDAGVEDDDEIAYDPRTRRHVAHPLKPISQDKKVHPPGMTKNMLKPTGFEESYAEPPLTPAEAEEEEAMYDPDKSFIERIEIAIQRFKQKRRMHEMYSKVFNKWMKFGGVDFAPRMFGALSKQEMKEMSAEEIARATAMHHVPWDREEKNKWVVDFVGVAEAFFSSFYPAHYGHLPTQVKTACQVLRSFYNYLLFHSVCDEYRSDILKARALCDKAEVELPQSYRAGNALPGNLNVAASSLFGGYYADAWVGPSGWGAELEEYERLDATVGMPREEAWPTFKWGLAFQEISDQVWLADPLKAVETHVDLINRIFKSSPNGAHNINIIEKVQTFLEVVDIKYPTDACKSAYETERDRYRDKTNAWYQPLGKLICKTWYTNDFTDHFKYYDLPPSKDPRYSNREPKEYVFWVEEHVLRECFVGLKMDASVVTLEYVLGEASPPGKLLVLDEVKETFCSFYKFLPNELWEAHKPPKFKLLNKGLEDVVQIETGEGAQEEMKNGEMEDDFEE